MVIRVYMIAGEVSGDILAADVMRSLRQQTPETIEFYGIGGAEMQAQGLNMFRSLDELSLIGLWEVLLRLPRLLRLVKQTREHIRTIKPHILITVDSPDFSVRIAKAFSSEDSDMLKIHCVAPTVWAWRQQRAKQFATHYHQILCLFPFEPPYFEKYNGRADFIGHPLVDNSLVKNDSQQDSQKLQLLLLPGSRHSEINRLAPIFLETAQLMQQYNGNLELICLTLPRFTQQLKKLFGDSVTISDDIEKKHHILRDATIAVAASGTIAMELAQSKTPYVIAYKINLLTAIILRLCLKVNYVSLPNIIANDAVMPELLQSQCCPKKLAFALIELLNDPEKTQQKTELAYQAVNQLRSPTAQNPSLNAAIMIYDNYLKQLKNKENS